MEAWSVKLLKINEKELQAIVSEELQVVLREAQLSEGFFSSVFGALSNLLGTGVVQNVKEWIAMKVLGYMGVKKGGVLSRVIVNMFGNLTLEDLSKIMSGDRQCIAATSEIAGGVTETLAESIPEILGIESDSWFAGAARESLGETFLEGINMAVAETVCEFDFTSLFKGKMNEDLNTKDIEEHIKNVIDEEKQDKPSSGLSKKKKSDVAKKAQKGKDIGKKGKGFDKVASKAAKKYGSKEAGERVAAAAMWKNIKR